VKRFRGGLVFKAPRLLYHSTLGLRVIKKKKEAGHLQTRKVLALGRGEALRPEQSVAGFGCGV